MVVWNRRAADAKATAHVRSSSDADRISANVGPQSRRRRKRSPKRISASYPTPQDVDQSHDLTGNSKSELELGGDAVAFMETDPSPTPPAFVGVGASGTSVSVPQLATRPRKQTPVSQIGDGCASDQGETENKSRSSTPISDDLEDMDSERVAMNANDRDDSKSPEFEDANELDCAKEPAGTG